MVRYGTKGETPETVSMMTNEFAAAPLLQQRFFVVLPKSARDEAFAK